MLAAILALSFILVTSIYRKVVVERLELKLYESATESKLAHLGQLAAWLAHEIKQPLTAINAWLWTLQKAIPTGTPEHLGTTAIRKEISRLDQIVKDFLRFTQPSVPKLAPVVAEPLLREIRDLLGPDLARQGIQLQLDGVAKARFSADPQQLKQVLINLITNAADSIEHDGIITLRARKDQARLKGRNSDVVIIEVEDTGQGIPPEVQQRLFDPFFSTKEEGTGLGLPIAANIIDKHGGLLEFKTDPGKGTIFAILLPLLKDAA
jgi:two-component system sensor histidine kinase AtoS